MRSLSEMLDDLTRKGPVGAARSLARFRDRQWAALNSYVHGGIHPIRRTADGYPTALLCDVLKSANALTLLAAVVVAEVTRDSTLAAGVLELSGLFPECVPDLKPFPDA